MLSQDEVRRRTLRNKGVQVLTINALIERILQISSSDIAKDGAEKEKNFKHAVASLASAEAEEGLPDSSGPLAQGQGGASTSYQQPAVPKAGR